MKKKSGKRNSSMIRGSNTNKKEKALLTVSSEAVEYADVAKSISTEGKILTDSKKLEKLNSVAYNNTLSALRSYGNKTIIDKDNGKRINYKVLRMASEKAFLINMCIIHSNRLVAPFCKVSTRSNERGFKIRLKDSTRVPTDEEKKLMRELEDFFFRTGFDKNKDRGNLIQFIKKGNRDLLTLDQICTEKQRTHDGSLWAFWAVDPATISKVAIDEAAEEDVSENERIKYVQEVDMKDVAYFSDSELEFDIMNPRSDVEHSMYGYSYVEQAIDLISGMIKSFQYNMGNFDSDNLPRGMLLLNGDPDPSTVEMFEDYIVSVMSSPADKWRIPIIPSGGDGAIQWLSLQTKNRDMEFTEWTNRLWASVAALFGTDLEELGIRLSGQTSVIPENPEARIVNSKSRVLGDLLSFWDSHFQNILDEIDDRFDFEFVGYEVDDIRKKDESRKIRLETYMTVNELRAEDDLQPIDDPICDLPLNPQLVILKGQSGAEQDMGEDFVGEQEDEEEENDGEGDKENSVEKSLSHKYLRKEFKNGKWNYVYKEKDGENQSESNNERRRRLAGLSALISDVQALNVDENNVFEKTTECLDKLKQRFSQNQYGKCVALNGKKVIFKKISNLHLFETNGKMRNMKEILSRARLLPFIPKIVEKTGILGEVRERMIRGRKVNDYELLGRGIVNGEEIIITVVLSDSLDKKLLYLSIFDVPLNNLKKTAKGEIEELTEPKADNQLRKASGDVPRFLFASCCFGIPSDRNQEYDTTGNEICQDKILIKAQKEREPERPVFKVIGELQNGFKDTFQSVLNVIYRSICAYLDLPVINQGETLVKAQKERGVNNDGENVLILRGKAIFSPQTGEPLKQKDFDRLIQAIEKYLNR